jgi:hypothetical protein
MVMSGKSKLVIAAVGFAILGVAFYLLFADKEKLVREGVIIYIEATKHEDFAVVYDYHAPSQRRKTMTLQTPASRESQLHDIEIIYKDQSASFEQAQPESNLKRPWSEKFLFTREMTYRILSVKMVEDRENPSLPVKERIVAYAAVEAEYPHKETAPDLGGKIRKVTYLVKMVHSRNVARTWEEKNQRDRWLFDSLALEEGSISYW